MPSKDVQYPKYRRLFYLRYADDFLLGFAGTIAEARESREKLRKFLETLKLELSEEKTLRSCSNPGCKIPGLRNRGSTIRQKAYSRETLTQWNCWITNTCVLCGRKTLPLYGKWKTYPSRLTAQR